MTSNIAASVRARLLNKLDSDRTHVYECLVDSASSFDCLGDQPAC